MRDLALVTRRRRLERLARLSVRERGALPAALRAPVSHILDGPSDMGSQRLRQIGQNGREIAGPRS